jgi:hypothetical protein
VIELRHEDFTADGRERLAVAVDLLATQCSVRTVEATVWSRPGPQDDAVVAAACVRELLEHLTVAVAEARRELARAERPAVARAIARTCAARREVAAP